MKNIFITGASGLLGGHVFCRAFSQHNVLGTYWKTIPATLNNCWAKVDLSDFRSTKSVLDAFKPDAIIHAAANSNLDDCEQNREAARKINVESTKNLAEYSAKKNVRFIFVSSDMVFNGKSGMYSEEDTTSPISYYGETKVMAEEFVKKTCRNFVIARSALIYGRSLEGGFSFSQWIEKKLNHGERMSLYTNQFRTPIYVANLAEVLIELAFNTFTGTLHLAGANKINRFDFGKQLCKLGGYSIDVLDPSLMNNAKTIAPRPKDISLSIKKAQKILETKLLTTEQGLLLMYKKRG